MKKSIRITGKVLKQLLRNLNGNTTLKNYCNFKVTPKKTWRVIKEVLGKSKLIHSTLPRKMVINENVIFEEKHIANAFNNLLQDLSKATYKTLIKH